MDDLEQFKKRIHSALLRAQENKVILFPFLSDRESDILLKEAKAFNIHVLNDGGIINAERKRYLITPFKTNVDFKIVVYNIIYNKKYYSISHRDILGSLMGLGIKRECIGDIVLIDKDCYFACTEEISSFILEEYNYVGNTPIKLERIDYPIIHEINYEYRLCFLASLRLDAVVAQATGVSRKEANEMITLGLVMVNHELIYNTSHSVALNDELSIRHKGHFIINNIGNETKSGRIKVEIGKRV